MYRVVTLNSRNQIMRTWIETADEAVAIKVYNSVTSLKPELNIIFQEVR
jgi:hypothetical protein